ncbi:hypothetical protein AAIR98_000708 [Elusimicrobium simillimum]|uniref:sulfatase-like hydrolase/transferase n=1 Tax=Elusimicrobium simillimum TaxID=3143438 RepID=UPI003C6FA405
MRLKNIFWFTILNYILWCLLSLKYYTTSGFFADFWGLAFMAAAIPGHLAMFAAGLLALTFLARAIGPRAARAACVIFGTLFTLFFIIDISVYSQYRFHISMAMLELFFGPAGGEIFVFPASMYAVMGVFGLLLVAGQFGLTVLANRINWGKKAVITVSVLTVLAVLLFNGIFAWGRFMAVPSVTGQVSYLPWANPVSLNSKLRKMGIEPKDRPYVVQESGTLNYPLAPLTCKNTSNLNVLLILVDSLRFDVFNESVMPNTFNRFVKDNGIYFANNLSGGNATQAGVFSLFYALPSTYWNEFTSEHKPPVLMTEFMAQGYDMAIYSSGKLNSPEFHKNIFSDIKNLRIESQGPDKYDRDIDMQRDFTNFILNRDGKKPFFGFLFYDSAHGFTYPPGFTEKFIPSKDLNYLTLTASTDPTPYMNRYKNSVHFIDSKLGELFAALEVKGLDKNTVIIITGDHGQEINDTGNSFWGHNSNFTKYQTKTPLVIFWPGKKGAEVSYRTSHYDIVPTIMQDALGCTNPAGDYSIGMNLFDTTPRGYSLVISYTNKAIVVDDKVSVLNNYGSLDSYDDNYKKIDGTVNPKAIGEALKTMSKFYK